MGTSIANHHEQNDREAGEIARQKVLDVFENAHIYVMNPHGMKPKFYVQYWWQASKFKFLSRYQNSESEAWIAAWRQIQLDMIIKLEG